MRRKEQKKEIEASTHALDRTCGGYFSPTKELSALATYAPCIALLFIVFVSKPSFSAPITYNVLSYGAKPNGVKDSTQAFLDAWSDACGSNKSTVIYVPKGRYMVGSMVFKGVCKSSDIAFRVDGTLVAPADYNVLGKAKSWLSFEGVSGVSILGGALDAGGSLLWACKLGPRSNNCPNGATTLSFTNSNNIQISGLMSINSQMFHIVINGCQNVHIERAKVIAAGDSPNTDGIHVQYSTNVEIISSSIKTGDDCISIGPGTKNLWIEHVTCGPGHGISIGSLGKELDEEGVQNVTVKRTIFSGSTNGFRIKSWARPSNGFVQGVRFIGAVMQNVQNPIIIDQHYCPHNLKCPNRVSGVRINDVMYQGIRGSSATSIAIMLDCSSKYPCTNIKLQNVHLTYMNRAAQSSCANAVGKTLGLVKPDSCL
ncbi:polygalacturonase-like [Tripterygium wilfordii]|uniref:Polygalacturonase-like n=1 Tax=Tripterygium wilfordii TaxID=458696 RepID=A0A7J7D5G1_TRIWF|nr:polygalacturonase-like [Tripterygium wilfordii]